MATWFGETDCQVRVTSETPGLPFAHRNPVGAWSVAIQRRRARCACGGTDARPKTNGIQAKRLVGRTHGRRCDRQTGTCRPAGTSDVHPSSARFIGHLYPLPTRGARRIPKLWQEPNAERPFDGWNDAWAKLFDFFEALFANPTFWDEKGGAHGFREVTPMSIASSIADLLHAGTRDDSRAYSPSASPPRLGSPGDVARSW